MRAGHLMISTKLPCLNDLDVGHKITTVLNKVLVFCLLVYKLHPIKKFLFIHALPTQAEIMKNTCTRISSMCHKAVS